MSWSHTFELYFRVYADSSAQVKKVPGYWNASRRMIKELGENSRYPASFKEYLSEGDNLSICYYINGTRFAHWVDKNIPTEPGLYYGVAKISGSKHYDSYCGAYEYEEEVELEKYEKVEKVEHQPIILEEYNSETETGDPFNNWDGKDRIRKYCEKW